MNEERFLFPEALRFIFVGKAIIDLSCESAERYLSSLITRAIGTETTEVPPLEVVRERLKTSLLDVSRTVVKRSESLQQEFKDTVHKQMADLSLEMLGDSSEINELRAEIASLRAELVQLRAQTKTNSRIAV
jgi:hypothetical protein